MGDSVVTVAERIARIERECSGVWASYGVTKWEEEFLRSMKQRDVYSQKQEDVLRGIEAKVFSEEEESDDE